MSFGLALAVLVPTIGAGVDSAMLYITKERLNTAVQLAAAKQPSSRAQQTFAANFPDGLLGVTGAVLDVKSDGQLVATVQAPTYFLRVFRVSSVTITASANTLSAASAAKHVQSQ